MIRTMIAVAALAGLTACGDGNPFDTTITDDDEAAANGIPADVAGAVGAFAYDPDSETLTIRGLLRDEDVTDVEYIRKPALDRGVYQAFTAQDDPLDEHTTVYVRELGSVSGATAVTGGQFSFFTGGVSYKREGGYDPVTISAADDTGLVTYTGAYIGLSDVNGPNTDLLPIPAGAGGGAVNPAQASVVTGRIFINVGFADNNVSGVIDRRVLESSAGPQVLPNVFLRPADLAADGTFSDQAEIIEDGNRTTVGTYSGILGGTDSEVMAGGIYAKDHYGDDPALTGITDEEEYGTFVLGKCGGDFEDASPDCDAVDD